MCTGPWVRGRHLTRTLLPPGGGQKTEERGPYGEVGASSWEWKKMQVAQEMPAGVDRQRQGNGLRWVGAGRSPGMGVEGVRVLPGQATLRPTRCGCRPPSSSVHGISQARTLECEGSCGGGGAPRDSAGSGATEEGLTSRGGRHMSHAVHGQPSWMGHSGEF